MQYFNDDDRQVKEKWAADLPRPLLNYYHSCKTFHDYYDEQFGPLINQNTMLLDVACGKKGIIEKYQGKFRLCVGVDLEMDSLTANSAVDMRVLADAGKLPFDDNTFDIVLNQWLAEHVEHTQSVYGELWRVLKPGGVMITVTNSIYNPMMIASHVLPFGSPCDRRIAGRKPGAFLDIGRIAVIEQPPSETPHHVRLQITVFRFA